jgi:predicted nucleic acid-binding protein
VAYLLDTNIIVYPFDHRDEAERDRARRVLNRLVEFSSAALSSQALTEFASVAPRSLPSSLRELTGRSNATAG